MFLVYFLVRREWRTVASVLVTGTIVLLVMLLLVGHQTLIAYAGSIGHTYALNDLHMNGSLVYRLGFWFVTVVLVLYLGVLFWRVRSDAIVGFQWTIATMILVSPIVWPYFLLWLFPVFAVWWQQNRRWLRIFLVALVAAYLVFYIGFALVAIQAASLIAIWLVLGWRYCQREASLLLEGRGHLTRSRSPE